VQDVIHNDDMKLDWEFKLSLLTDLVMVYLLYSLIQFGWVMSLCAAAGPDLAGGGPGAQPREVVAPPKKKIPENIFRANVM